MSNVNIKKSLVGRPVLIKTEKPTSSTFKPVKCCISNCSSNVTINAKKINFHKFPRQKKVKKEWVKALQDAKLYKKATKTSGWDCDDWFICSRHFRKDDYLRSSPPGSRSLDGKAVPSVFVVPPKLRSNTSVTAKQPTVVTEATILESRTATLNNGISNGDGNESESSNSSTTSTTDKPVTRYSSFISSLDTGLSFNTKEGPQLKSVEKGMVAAVKSWLYPTPSATESPSVVKKMLFPKLTSTRGQHNPRTTKPSIPKRSIKSIKRIKSKTESLKRSNRSSNSAKSTKINPKNVNVNTNLKPKSKNPVVSKETSNTDTGTNSVSKETPRRSMRVASSNRSQRVPFQIPWTHFYPAKRRYSKISQPANPNPSQTQTPSGGDLSCKPPPPKSQTQPTTPNLDHVISATASSSSKIRSLKTLTVILERTTTCADPVGCTPSSLIPPPPSVQVAVDNYLSSSSAPPPPPTNPPDPTSSATSVPPPPVTGRRRKSAPKPRPPKVNLNMSLAKKRSGLARPVQNIRNAKPERRQHACVETMLSSAITKILETGSSKKIKFKSFTYQTANTINFTQPKPSTPVALPRHNTLNKHQSHKRNSGRNKAESSDEDEDDSLYIDGKAPWDVDDDEKRRNKRKYIGHKLEISGDYDYENYDDEGSNGYDLASYKELNFKMESDDDDGDLSNDPLENEGLGTNGDGEIVTIKQEKMEADDEYSTPLLNGFEFNVGMCQEDDFNMISSSADDDEGQGQFKEESFADSITTIECIPDYNLEDTDEFSTEFDDEHASEVFNIVKAEIMDSDSCHSDVLLPDIANVKVESETIFI